MRAVFLALVFFGIFQGLLLTLPEEISAQRKYASSVTGTADIVQCSNRPGTVSTAIGCVDFNNINVTSRFFLRWALGIAGGVALFLIGLASYQIATSQGDPRRLQSGQELLLSAIGGLIMIILSVFLLRFIGVNLLGIL